MDYDAGMSERVSLNDPTDALITPPAAYCKAPDEHTWYMSWAARHGFRWVCPECEGLNATAIGAPTQAMPPSG